MQNQPQSFSTVEHRQFARLYLDTLFKGKNTDGNLSCIRRD